MLGKVIYVYKGICLTNKKSKKLYEKQYFDPRKENSVSYDIETLKLFILIDMEQNGLSQESH